MMNKRSSLIALTSLTATFVAFTAAFFSVTGIAKLFAGATIGVLVMATSLELGKIVGISFLYQYWKEIPKLLKAYLVTASAILMIITSLGIYGFLSGAYQATADQLNVATQQSSVLELKKARFQDELGLLLQERDRLSGNIQELSRGMANNQQQYRDAQTGQILTTSSSANRIALQKQLTVTSSERSGISTRIEALSDSIGGLDIQLLEMNTNNDIAAEVGPLRFISNITGWSMDSIVNIFALLIVFVFDPLAIALVIAINFLIKQGGGGDADIPNLMPSNPSGEIPSTQIQLDQTPTPSIVEPYKVYAPEQEEVREAMAMKKPTPSLRSFDEVVNTPPQMDWGLLAEFFKYKYGGIPNWMNPDFKWNSTEYEWQRNPLAVEYKQSVVDKQQST
jgi:hypothetical protein